MKFQSSKNKCKNIIINMKSKFIRYEISPKMDRYPYQPTFALMTTIKVIQNKTCAVQT